MIVEFGRDRTLFNTVLADPAQAGLLEGNPGANKLYKLCKDNAGLLPVTLVQRPAAKKLAQAGHLAKLAWNWVGDQFHGAIEGVKEWGQEVDRGIRQIYGAP